MLGVKPERMLLRPRKLLRCRLVYGIRCLRFLELLVILNSLLWSNDRIDSLGSPHWVVPICDW